MIKELLKWLENEAQFADSYSERCAFLKVIEKVKELQDETENTDERTMGSTANLH